MKKNNLFPIIFSLAVFFSLFLASCTKQQKNDVTKAEESALSLYKNVEAVEALALDTKFNLSATVYNDFLNSLMFKDEQLRGFYYKDIVENMSNQELKAFWGYFKVSVQLEEDSDQNAEVKLRNGNPPMLSDEFCIYYDSVPFACRPSPGWVCMIMC
ncbi:MAG: hypothetical protein AAGG75_20745 [Bacteroidota bacterium]